MNTDILKIGLSQDSAENAFSAEDALLHAKPRLRRHVAVRTQISRGETWRVIENKETGASYRLDNDGYNVVVRLDGATSVHRILADLAISDVEKQYALSLLNQLMQADLVLLQGPATGSLGSNQNSMDTPSFWPQKLKNPLAIRIPVWDPDSFLTRTEPSFSRCLNRFTIAIFCLLMLFGLIATYQHFNALSNYGLARAGELSSWLTLMMVYPFIKAIHEFAHAYSIKRHGGEVHEMGLMLLVFFPVPYVDASASAAFEHKKQRIEVAGAGIAAELMLAAIAMIVWANIQHGMLSDLAFSIALIGGLSTLLFNGNPLLRFDGYFVFADWLEIPNLAARSRSYCLYLIKRSVLGVTGLISPVTAPGESAWFVTYFCASSAYRFFITFGIAIYLIQLIPLFGLLLAILAVTNQFVRPSLKAASYLINAQELSTHRPRSIGAVSAVFATILAAIIVIPMPSWITLPGVVKLPESGIVRASEPGFVRELVSLNGAYVLEGQTIAILDHHELDKEAKRLHWKIQELEARRASVVLSSPSEAAQFNESINAVAGELNDINRRLQATVITAPTSGYLQYLTHGEWRGRYLDEGTALANVINKDERKIITVVPESHIAKIRQAETHATLRTPAAPQKTLLANIASMTPAGSRDLADATFGSKRGGSIAVDSRDESGKLALEQTFQIELIAATGGHLLPGSSVYVRFDMPASSIASQAYAAISRLLMKEINW